MLAKTIKFHNNFCHNFNIVKDIMVMKQVITIFNLPSFIYLTPSTLLLNYPGIIPRQNYLYLANISTFNDSG